MSTLTRKLCNIIIVVFLFVVPVSLAFYSEYVQRNLTVYWSLNQQFGKGIADFILGNLGDMMAPFALGGTIYVLMAFLIYVFKVAVPADYNYSYRFAVLMMVIISGSSILVELYSFFGSNSGAICQQTEWCPGDFADLLVFGVPIIALVIWRFVYGRKAGVSALELIGLKAPNYNL